MRPVFDQAAGPPSRGLRSHLLPLALVLVTATCLLAAYGINRPHADVYPDTATYLRGARGLLAGRLFNTERLPGYPLLLVLTGAGGGWNAVLLPVQALLFLASCGLTYFTAVRIFGRRWVAAACGLVVASDLYVAALSRAVLSETLALALISGLTAAAVAFAELPSPRRAWLVAGLGAAAALTRPEWVFFPLAILAYLGLLSLRNRTLARSAAVHAAAATAACYLVIGMYVAGNALFNGFLGTTEITNVSLLGKVMEYRMELEAPPAYAREATLVDGYARLNRSPWDVVHENPQFAADHYRLAGSFARAVLLADPARFARLSLDEAMVRDADFDPVFVVVDAQGHLVRPLLAIEAFTTSRYVPYFLTVALGLFWAGAGILGRSAARVAPGLGVVALTALYGTAITALGGFDEFGRYHAVFVSAMAILVWGTLALNLRLAVADRRLTLLAAVAAGGVAVDVAASYLFPHLQSILPRILLTLLVIAVEGFVLWLAGARQAFAVARD